MGHTAVENESSPQNEIQQSVLIRDKFSIKTGCFPPLVNQLEVCGHPIYMA